MRGQHLKSPLPIEPAQLKALIMDVDGTLYRQNRVRGQMLWRLLRAHIGQPRQGFLILRVLSAYRKAHEVLRKSPMVCNNLSVAQLQLASKWTGVGPEVVSSCVARWMEQEPLEILALSLRKGLVNFLQNLRRRRLRLGALSDYPAEAKLAAMGITHFFDVIVAAQDADIQQLKPNPRGLEIALQRLGVEKNQALYVGDRPEVDAAAASNAGVACVIIGGRRNPTDWPRCIRLPGYRELNDAVCPKADSY